MANKSKEKSAFHGKLISKDHNKAVECRVDLLIYEEDNVHFVYSPSLDLVGYGVNKKEALSSWEVVYSEYIRYCLNKNTLFNDLQKHGWKVKNKKAIQPPTFSWLMQNNVQLSEVYDNHNFQKTSTQISLPLSNVA